MKIVVGAGYGDEGKGRMVSALCANGQPPKMVVRFNGGHQAGHTVVRNGRRHVFSTAGAGTLHGVPTYWSENCTVSPPAILREREALQQVMREAGFSCLPILFIDPEAPVTTPIDVLRGRKAHAAHGTVGVGFGATIERHSSGLKIFARDLLHPSILTHKLSLLYSQAHSELDAREFLILRKMLDEFFQAVDELFDLDFGIQIKRPVLYLSGNETVFEGAQGILLDQDYGFFPHVTHSYCTTRNAWEIAGSQQSHSTLHEVIYMTRAYLTRHGTGPLPGEGEGVMLTSNPNETNKKHEYQGEFRIAPFNFDTLRYALSCDAGFSQGAKKSIAVTCMDQLAVENAIRVIENGIASELSHHQFFRKLFELAPTVYVSPDESDSPFIPLAALGDGSSSFILRKDTEQVISPEEVMV